MQLLPLSGADASLFVLVAARLLGLVFTAPLLSGRGIPRVAKAGIALLAAGAVLPAVKSAGYAVPSDQAAYALIFAGEALIGALIGFYLTLVYSTLTTASGYFSTLTGFGSAEALDPVSGSETSLIARFFDIAAAFVFISTRGFQRLFITGVEASFVSLKAGDLAARKGDLLAFVLRAAGSLFADALVLALPILGTLVLLWIVLGLVYRAAPQFNLLAEGFSLIAVATCIVVALTLPAVLNAFSDILDSGFSSAVRLAGRI